jgi:hypothetical protein
MKRPFMRGHVLLEIPIFRQVLNSQIDRKEFSEWSHKWLAGSFLLCLREKKSGVRPYPSHAKIES